MGEFPEHDQTATGSDDPQRIVNLTAHAVARIGDRFTFLRKLNRHLEGQERKAGLLSDVVSVLIALYKRNPETFETLGKQFGSDLAQRRAAAKAATNGGTPAQTQGVTATHAT